jgi:hypothetical protein
MKRASRARRRRRPHPGKAELVRIAGWPALRSLSARVCCEAKPETRPYRRDVRLLAPLDPGGRLTPAAWTSFREPLTGRRRTLARPARRSVRDPARVLADRERRGIRTYGRLIVIQRQLGHSNLGITSVYLQGIDNAEIIDTVHARRAPMIQVSASRRL